MVKKNDNNPAHVTLPQIQREQHVNWQQNLIALLRIPYDYPVAFTIAFISVALMILAPHLVFSPQSIFPATNDPVLRARAQKCEKLFTPTYGDVFKANKLIIAGPHTADTAMWDCIEAFQPDEVLLETLPSGQEIDCEGKMLEPKKRFVNKKSECRGWDLTDPTYYQRLRKRSEHMRVTNLVDNVYQEYRSFPASDREFAEALEQKIQKYVEIKASLEKKYGYSKSNLTVIAYDEREVEYQLVTKCLEKLHSMGKQLLKGQAMEQIYHDYALEVATPEYIAAHYLNDDDENIGQEMLARNKVLFNTLEKNSYKKSAAYVGLFHMVNDFINPEDNREAVQYILEKVKSSKNRYAVLTMLPDTQQFKDKLKKRI